MKSRVSGIRNRPELGAVTLNLRVGLLEVSKGWGSGSSEELSIMNVGRTARRHVPLRARPQPKIYGRDDQRVSELRDQLAGVTTETFAFLQEKVQDNIRLQRENTRQASNVARLEEENTRYKDEKTRLQEEVRQLQSRVDQQPKLGSDSDISFWQVSQREVSFTDHVLGSGAWGRVTMGNFRGQKVAIKQLHSTIVSPHYSQLVRREISLMAKIRHPNLLLFIAAVLDTPGRSGTLIITELLDTDLRNAYQNGQLASDRVRLSILMDVAAALNYLHLQREPIIHRDVSSANVLLQALPDRKWRGKLSDFGSANLARYATTPGPGAIVYCAPEAFDEGKQSPKLDVFSYGKLLCEVLTSQFPFKSEFPSIQQSIVKKWPLVHKITSLCVDRDPAKRPSMSSIINELEQEESHLEKESTSLTAEIAHLRRENTHLKEEMKQLQSRFEQQQFKRPGNDSDISHWLVSHKEIICFTHEIGRGGYCQVTTGSFRGQKVAIKQLHSTIVSPHYSQLVRREISLMAKIRHPNILCFIAAVLDSPGHSGPLIISELLDTDLRNAYQNGQLASDRVRLSILRDVAAALNYLHNRTEPIIHRDLSSSNILLQALPDKNWRGKLSGFTSANLARYATTPCPGSRLYCAPEALKEEEQTTKMDVYSYGVLSCEVFNNQIPHPHDLSSMLQSIPGVFPLLHDIVSSCLKKDPTRRPTMSNILDQQYYFFAE